MHYLKQLFISVHPLIVTVGIDIVVVHDAVQIIALGITSVYTLFRIKKDFFSKGNKNEKI